MIKLSFHDKCWLTANIEKVLTAPALFALIITFAIFTTYVEGRNYFEFVGIVGVVGILVLIYSAYLSAKYAYKITRFAEDNFNEVVSRQTKYRKSNVELHEIKYRYMIETFAYAFIGLYAPVFSVVWIAGFLINI